MSILYARILFDLHATFVYGLKVGGEETITEKRNNNYNSGHRDS